MSTSINLDDTRDRQKVRGWILKAVQDDKRNGVSLSQILKFLDSKEEGISKKPEVKAIIKRAFDTGHLVREDRKIKICAKPKADAVKRHSAQKADAKKTSKKASSGTSKKVASGASKKASAGASKKAASEVSPKASVKDLKVSGAKKKKSAKSE